MAITTRSERKHRRLDALEKLNTGWRVGDTISYLVKDYDITLLSAHLDVAWASTELCENFDNTEYTDILTWLLTQIQRVAVKNESSYLWLTVDFFRDYCSPFFIVQGTFEEFFAEGRQKLELFLASISQNCRQLTHTSI